VSAELAWLLLAGIGAGLTGSVAGLASLVSYPSLLAAGLPPVVANPALVCQVFYNIIRNALQARPRGLVLDLSAEETEAGIRIRIADNGPGIDPSIINRIFEPFFTTRDVGAGTGMGLAVAYEIISSQGGSIEVESEPGAGAAFTVLFPQGGRRHG